MQENALPTSQMLTMEKYFIHSFYVMGKILSVISVYECAWLCDCLTFALKNWQIIFHLVLN